jgi:hypothetical protein
VGGWCSSGLGFLALCSPCFRLLIRWLWRRSPLASPRLSLLGVCPCLLLWSPHFGSGGCLPCGLLSLSGPRLVGWCCCLGHPPAGGGWRTVSGVSMSLLAGAGFSARTLLAARPCVGQYAVTSAGLLLGGVLLLPFALVEGMGVPLSAEVLGLVAYLGVVPTAVATGRTSLGFGGRIPTRRLLLRCLSR